MSKTKVHVTVVVAALLAVVLTVGIRFSVNTQQQKILDETGIFNQLIFVISKCTNDNSSIPMTVDSVIARLDDRKSKGSLISYAKQLSISESGDIIKMRGSYGDYTWYSKEQRYVFKANKK